MYAHFLVLDGVVDVVYDGHEYVYKVPDTDSWTAIEYHDRQSKSSRKNGVKIELIDCISALEM